MIGLLLEIPPLVTFGLPFEIIGLVILIVRVRGALAAGLNLAALGAARHGAAFMQDVPVRRGEGAATGSLVLRPVLERGVPSARAVMAQRLRCLDTGLAKVKAL